MDLDLVLDRSGLTERGGDLDGSMDGLFGRLDVFGSTDFERFLNIERLNVVERRDTRVRDMT